MTPEERQEIERQWEIADKQHFHEAATERGYIPRADYDHLVEVARAFMKDNYWTERKGYIDFEPLRDALIDPATPEPGS